MALRIEDYAVIGDLQTCALVGRDGSIDWLCVPRFDSPACFAALLGTADHGRWQIAPADGVVAVRRRYRGDSLILETEFECSTGRVRLTDFMPVRTAEVDIFRIVEGLEGSVPMRMELAIRFDYGSIVPWVRSIPNGIRAIAGPDALHCRGSVPMYGREFTTFADFTVAAGQRETFEATWCRSSAAEPPQHEVAKALADTEAFWAAWVSHCTYEGPWRDAVVRSLITLKAMTYQPTGGLVAAATMSLPEQIGGVRNWDYRYCWLRDATLSLYALLDSGYSEEAHAWRDWLIRAVAGRPEEMQIMYGIRGERHLVERELDWLPGYEGSLPVRLGNAAYRQHQLDVYGEVMDTLHHARRLGHPANDDSWRVQRAIMGHLESAWKMPDEGIWEVRGPRRHFTHSKVMAWVAFDRAVTAVESFGREGPADVWRTIRDEIRAEVLERGFDRRLNAFVQFYGSTLPDASLLVLPSLGFIDANDPRMVGTVELIRKELAFDGLLLRYRAEPDVDGLPPGEGAFLLCTFWLADVLSLQGKQQEAEELFERMLSLRNDVGLLAEQYDPIARRQVGNFPQAFSHTGLINTALNLVRREGPARERQK